MGTHDLIAHIAGIEGQQWDRIKKTAERVEESLTGYFHSTSTPSISSLILPYTIGVVLDDLAQPPSYDSTSHLAVLNVLLLKLHKNEILPGLATTLLEFPASFQNIINLSRTDGIEKDPVRIQNAVDLLVQDILEKSLT